jgi:hypothetical protein
MGAKAIDATRHSHAAQSPAPSDGVSLTAGGHGQRIRRLRPASNDFVYLFLDIDVRFSHDGRMIGRHCAGCKQQPARPPLGAKAQDS